MLNPWVILAIAAAWLASVAGVGYWQRSDGALSCETAYKTRDNKVLVEANLDNARLAKAVRDTESRHQDTLANIGQFYAKEFNDAEARRKRDVAAAHTAAGRLRDSAGTCGQVGTSAPSPAVASASGGDGATGCQLSGQTSAALFDLAHDADRDVRQLGKCQAVVREYLQACNSEQ